MKEQKGHVVIGSLEHPYNTNTETLLKEIDEFLKKNSPSQSSSKVEPLEPQRD